MSGDPEQEYFADGMVQDIITALSRFKSLFVIACRSSLAYKGKEVDIKQVGRELGVRYVLEGSVRKAGGRVRITGLLIEAETGAHIWAEQLDGPIEDIFGLQDNVTEQVVCAMAPRITNAEIERTRIKRPDSLDSYDHLLRAWSLALPRSIEGLRTAIGHLDKAIALAPTYSLAHGLIAECYGVLDMILGTIWSGEPEKALLHARRAMELDRDDPEVLACAAYAICSYEDVAASVALTERAVALNPNLARAWVVNGFSRLYLAQHDEALASFQRALRLNPIDPRNPTTMGGIATVHFLQGKYADALKWSEKALLEMPSNLHGLHAMAITASATGDRARAKAASDKLLSLYPRHLDRIQRLMRRQEDFQRISDALQLAASSK